VREIRFSVLICRGFGGKSFAARHPGSGVRVKAISLWQPWALLWLLSDPDEKVFETRGWYTGYRGPLLIHAAKKQDREVTDFIGSGGFRRALDSHGITVEALHFGAIIGEINLVGCSQMSRMPEPSEREQMWGNWEPDRYAWERGPKPVIFRQPIPYRGSQGFFDVPGEFREYMTPKEAVAA
jgi:hypothetical protein